MEENSSQSNKYDAALAKYNTNLSDADIQARVADLIEKKVPENNTEEVKKLLFNCIDLTTLNSTDSDESVMHFTEKVNEFDNEFPDMKNVTWNLPVRLTGTPKRNLLQYSQSTSQGTAWIELG